MPQITSNRRRSAAAVAPLLLLASLALAACGGSSKSSSSSTNASASAATTSTGPNAAGPRGGRFTAIRACLQKDGITLPQRTPGQRPPAGAGGLLGGGIGAQLPKGMTRAQYEADLKKCGITIFGPRGRAFNPARIQALTKFAACMRTNGVNLPAPNASGKGPVFNAKGINRTSAQFRTAEAKCSGELRGAFGGARPGAAPPGGAGAGAPSGAGPPGA
jgi:hypothetical protein